jgi:hypothetical protein
LAGGVRSGFFLRCFFGLARRWSTPVVSEVVGWMCYVFSLDARWFSSNGFVLYLFVQYKSVFLKKKQHVVKQWLNIRRDSFTTALGNLDWFVKIGWAKKHKRQDGVLAPVVASRDFSSGTGFLGSWFGSGWDDFEMP